MKKDIFIILPYKESLNPNFAGAVSLYVKIQPAILYIKKEFKSFLLMISIIKVNYLEIRIISLTFVKSLKKKKTRLKLSKFITDQNTCHI